MGPVALAWTPFYWVAASTDSAHFRHAGILFRSALQHQTATRLMQLDLGASGNMPDGMPEPPGRERPVRPLGQLYGLLGARGYLDVAAGAQQGNLASWRNEPVGTAGLPLYMRQVLVLDLVNQRLATDTAAAVAEALAALALAIFPADRTGMTPLTLTVSAKSGRSYSAALDTGLSPFPVWASRAVWEELTQLTGIPSHTRTYRLPNPRGELVFVGAPLRTRLTAGSYALPATEVVFLAAGPPGSEPRDWQPAVDLLLGPALFAERAALLVDLRRSRFGILPPLAR